MTAQTRTAGESSVVTLPALTHVALNLLEIDDVNVRKTGRGSKPALFVGSIAAKGIIEPLTVRQSGKGFLVVNGGKRLAALQFMRDHGLEAAGVLVDDNYPVPVNVRDESDAAARETSLITNLVRDGMHPVDEYEAFARLRDDGMEEAEIGARFGISHKGVRQRLALGRLSPKVREAWREGKIGGNAAMAFTLTPSVKDQERVLAQLQKDSVRNDSRIEPWSVKRAFAAKDRNIGHLIAFVGVEQLQAAGVKVVEDLFGTDHRATDPKKVAALAAEKLEAECRKLVEQGWGWAVTSDDPSVHNRAYLMPTLPYRDVRPSPEEKERIKALKAVALDEDGYPRNGPEAEAALAEIDAIESAAEARAYKPAEKARAGCIVSIGERAELFVQYGKLKQAEADKVRREEKKKERKKAGKPEGVPEISNAVMHDLGVTLTRAARDAVRKQPDLALTFALAGLSSRYGSVHLRNDGMFAHDVDRDTEFDQALSAIAAMTPQERMELLAEHVGAAFRLDTRLDDAGSDASLICSAIDGEVLNEAMRHAFDAADYFKRTPAAVAVQAIEEAVNADEARRVAKLKKVEIVAFAVDNVPQTGWLPRELRTVHYDGPGTIPKKPEKPAKTGRSKP